ncbi:MAG: permease [Planctomycetota bacterium]|nr:MAG: permease [Planctomycetota bacterium]
MNRSDNPYQAPALERPVAELTSGEQASFLTRTYAHLTGAVILFAAIEWFLLGSEAGARIAASILSVNWLIILGAFMLVGWLCSRAAHSVRSVPLQYAALIAFVAIQAVIFLPLLFVAEIRAPGTIRSAGLATLIGFTGLTAIVFFTGKDFSFLRGLLFFGGLLALAAIVLGAIFGTALGTWFSVAMIGFAGVSVLYDTSNILHHYPRDRHVGAALELFGSLALMFWYVLRLMSRR